MTESPQKDYPNAFYRMPLGFGPCPGPRQTEEAQPHKNWSKVSVTTATITFKASKELLSSYLPHECFRIDNDNDASFASVVSTHLENLPWLGGHGYCHYGLYIHDVVCTGKLEKVRGKYLVVLFENRADPIISGREELGYAKLFCDLNGKLDVPNRRYSVTASWEGTSFSSMELSGLKARPKAMSPKVYGGGSEGTLHFKSIPKTGEPGKFDVQYPTFSPNTTTEFDTVEEDLVADVASFAFDASSKDRLPTLSHVVSGLAEIEIFEIVGARVVKSMGQSDFRDQRAITI